MGYRRRLWREYLATLAAGLPGATVVKDELRVPTRGGEVLTLRATGIASERRERWRHGDRRVALRLPCSHDLLLLRLRYVWHPEHQRVVLDVPLGDEAFDERYVVEGAPEAAIRALLGPERRRWLLEHRAAELTIADRQAELILPVELGSAEPSIFTFLEELVADVPRAIAAALDHAGDEAPRETALAPGPFRASQAVDLDEPRRRLEEGIRHLRQARDLEDRRLRRAGRIALGYGVGVIACFVGARLLRSPTLGLAAIGGTFLGVVGGATWAWLEQQARRPRG